MIPAAWRRLWRRALRLGVPATGQSVAHELMRTIDVVVTAALSPAAVVAIGIADLYTSLPERIGGGVVGAASILAAQDTGAGADANRDETLTQAALISAAVVLPFAVVGFGFGAGILRLVGTDAEAARKGGVYLAVIAPTLPMNAVRGTVAAALRGTGDTKTPMYVSVPTDALNAAGSVVFGLGVLGAPRLGVAGVAAATLVSTALAAVALVAYAVFRSPLEFVWPSNWTVASQLVRLAAPKSAAGAVTTLAVFPFNTLLLGFGTAVNAGYQLAWRVYSQLIGPIGSGVGTATSVIVGQAVGSGDREETRTAVRALLALGAAVAVTLGAGTVLAARPLAALLTDDAAVVASAAAFIAVHGVVAAVGITNVTASAVLDAGSETRIPLASRLLGMVGGMVGVSWALARGLHLGVVGAYAGLVACYVLMLAVSAWGVSRADWLGRAATLLDERGSTTDR
ncbi:MATE family efflux transporter [Halobaculum sp. P14]|uniref:MATE family efflux transporter n=1 Tax=Halobaculum sp. P14 TaxID=3421638 RepID=UPI003EB6F4FD